MAYFVIAGKPNCSAFVHAIHVARYLEDNLPNFNIHVIQKKTGDWEPWLEDINLQNRWFHSFSPLIWKELSMRGGVAHYVGGLCEFWEYCYDYYGLESILSPEDLEKMVEDNMQFFQEMERREAENSKNIRHIGIVGLYNQILRQLLIELVEIPDLQKSCGIKIHLYEIHETETETIEFIQSIIEDIEPLATNGDLEVFNVTDRMQDVLKDCDLLIILGDYNRRADEMESDWLTRNMSAMFLLADEINAFGKRNLRVVLAIDGPVCFDANILIDTCTAIRIQNIVAVTSDIGLGPLKCAAEQANIPLDELSAPPVWGFVGINHFVDVHSVIIRSDIYRPYQRVIRNKGGSTLPLGIIQPELRYMAYLIEDAEDVWLKAANIRSIIKRQLDRPPIFAKIRSLVSLLKLWYAKEPSDDIISLGICSNGAHGLPTGIVFSQPVILEKNLWVPFRHFPVTEKSRKEVAQLIPPMLEITEKMNVGPCAINDIIYTNSLEYCRM